MKSIKSNAINIETSNGGLSALRSKTENHIHSVLSNRSEVRIVQHRTNDATQLLEEIGYKQELNRHYSVSQAFGKFLI